MCILCDWGEMYPEPGPEAEKAAAMSVEERERASREMWSRLMAELDQADAERAKLAEDAAKD